MPFWDALDLPRDTQVQKIPRDSDVIGMTVDDVGFTPQRMHLVELRSMCWL